MSYRLISETDLRFDSLFHLSRFHLGGKSLQGDSSMRSTDPNLTFQMSCIVWPAVAPRRLDLLQTLMVRNWKAACETTISLRHTQRTLCLRFGRKMTRRPWYQAQGFGKLLLSIALQLSWVYQATLHILVSFRCNNACIERAGR